MRPRSADSPLLSVKDAEEDMNLTVSDACAVGDIAVRVFWCGRPIDAGANIRANLEFGSDAGADERLVVFGCAGDVVAASVSLGLSDIHEGAEGEVPIRASVSLLRCGTEVANEGDIHRLPRNGQGAREVEAVFEGSDPDRVADGNGMAIAATAVEPAGGRIRLRDEAVVESVLTAKAQGEFMGERGTQFGRWVSPGLREKKRLEECRVARIEVDDRVGPVGPVPTERIPVGFVRIAHLTARGHIESKR